jgi:hypothetical protein
MGSADLFNRNMVQPAPSLPTQHHDPGALSALNNEGAGAAY